MPSQAVDYSAIATAAGILRAGGLVAFPTETVYGLGANAFDPEAVGRIFAVKGRPSTSPLIVHVASIEMALSLVSVWPEIAGRLARRYWPGPLTLVLERSSAWTDASVREAKHSSTLSPRSAPLPEIVTAGLPTIALRMPAHAIALALIRAAGVPVAAPSANRFMQLSPMTADHVRAGLGDHVDYILDGGRCQVGIESTVLSLAGPQPVLLRLGGVSRQHLESQIGLIIVATNPSTGAHPSPGMHLRHYSPRTPLFLANKGEVPGQGSGTYLQHRRPPIRLDIVIIEMPKSPSDYAAVLYETLHCADSSGLDWIVVDMPPIVAEWESIHDRLRRAAST